MRRLTERSESVAKLIPDGAAWDALNRDIYVEQVEEAVGKLGSVADEVVETLFDAALKKAHGEGMELTEDLAMEILEEAVAEVKQDYERVIDHLIEEVGDQFRKMGRPSVDFTEPDEGEKAKPLDFTLSWR